ncbi:MAG: tetratricopeptide repeat protein [Gammaproteobacteria bacterium]
MRSIITVQIIVLLSVFCRAVLADSLAELPSAWQQRLVSIAHIDVSPLKVDERKAITETRASIDALLLSEKPDEDRLAAEYGRLGNLYLIHELHTSADACYQNAMQLAPDHFPWAYYAAYLAQQNGNMQAALPRFQHALKVDPDYQAARYRLAQVYLDLKRLDQASALFESLLEDPAYAAAAHNGLGQLMAIKQDHDQAVDHFRQALALEPTATQIHYPLALSLRTAGRTDLAKEHLSLYGRHEIVIKDRLVEALQMLRNPASRHFVTAMTAVIRKEFAKAVTDFESGLEYEPDNTAARTSYARVLYLTGDKAKARSQLEKIVVQQPDKSIALFLLALLDDESNNTEAAAALYRRVIELDAAHAGANFFLGNYFLNKQDYSNAIKHYQTVINSDEKNIPAQIFKLAAMMASGSSDKELLAVARSITERVPNMLSIKRIQILILSLSNETDVRNSKGAKQLAEQMYQAHRNPVNAELLALANASAGNYSLAAQQMREAIAAEKQHKKSQNMTRMVQNLQLVEMKKLPELEWHEDIKHMQPPPANALSTFRDYPDANPI